MSGGVGKSSSAVRRTEERIGGQRWGELGVVCKEWQCPRDCDGVARNCDCRASQLRKLCFPPRLVQGLHEASPAEIANVEVIGARYGLHWESLDLDYGVPGLMNGIFGTAKWMVP